MTQARDLADGKFDTSTLVVDAANNRVGIGTASPTRPLTISDPAAGIQIVETDASGAAYAFVSQGGNLTIQDDNDGNPQIAFNKSGSYIQSAASGGHVFTDTSNTIVKFASDGNVGIGTTSPSSKLHVVGDVTVSGSVSSTPMTNTWQITSSKSGGGDITANWAKTTYYSTASSGSDMTQSSGVFTFPETGIYSIEFTVCFISTSADDTIEANIKATVDGTNYANIGQIKTGTEPGGYKKSAFVKAIFDVTNTSTHKVKFNINSFGGTIDADSNFPLTGAFFTKLGST